MCGRFHVDDETAIEIGKLVRQAGERIHRDSLSALSRIVSADIRPSDQAPILCAAEGWIVCAWLRWGFPQQQGQGKGLIFNARCESAAEKPLFREGLRHRRIAVPAASFYEWDRERNRYTFQREGRKPLFLAGCCRYYGDEERFVILTTAANSSMQPVHDRMPLLLEETEVADWILDNGRTESLLRKTPPLLDRSTDYEQMRFF